MPVQKITKGGMTMYRYGDSGKMYKTKNEAEMQGRAMYAAGYRKPNDNRAERDGREVTKDLEYDMGNRGRDDAKAERAGRRVTKDIEYDMKRKRR